MIRGSAVSYRLFFEVPPQGSGFSGIDYLHRIVLYRLYELPGVGGNAAETL